MPINRSNNGLNSGMSSSVNSRLSSSTISSSAKSRPDMNQSSNGKNDYIMKPTSNLTRTRSLRLPSRTRDHNYLMSGQLINNCINTNGNDSKISGSLSRHSSFRTSSESSSSQQSSVLETSLNSNQMNKNVATRTTKSGNKLSFMRDGLIPKMVRNSLAKLNRSSNQSQKSFDDSHVQQMRLSLNDCPSSPVSNSSRDSGIIGINTNNESQNYLKILRKLTEEHEKLQIEYSRVRQQLIEMTATLPQKSSTSEDIKTDNEGIEKELEKERSLSKNYKLEAIRLEEQLRRLQRKYWENIIDKKNIDNHIESEAHNWSICQHDCQESKEIENSSLNRKIESLQNKVKELESERKETKENLEFITSERSILAESLKEGEENLHKERLVWIKEKEAFEEVRTWSKRIYDKLKEKSQQIKEFETIINEKNTEIEELKKSNELNQNIAQVLCQSLNCIRETVLSVLLTNESISEINIRNDWPEINISIVKHSDDLKIDLNFIKQFLFNNLKDSENKINGMVKENNETKRNLINTESMLKEKTAQLIHLMTENELNQKKLIKMNEELDSLSEKNRCSEAMNNELKAIIQESNQSTISSQTNGCLRVEIASLKETLSVKEDMINKLSAKYSRNRKVWEENDRKATQEIKKLDDIVDHVIESLKSMPESLKNSESIQEIIELLTDGIIESK